MLETRRKAAGSASSAKGLDVEIAGLATAVPRHVISQAEVTERVRVLFPQLVRREGLYANTGIQRRHTCEPPEWYLQRHGWEARTERFQLHALSLLEQVAIGAVKEAGIGFEAIGAILVNTITGLAIPSLDAKLMNRLPLGPNVERVPLFGLGCGGGVAGLGRAARYASTMPGRDVLFLTVDLCTLSLRAGDASMAMFVSTALFGDGAAGVVLRSSSREPTSSHARLHARVIAMGEHFWPGTEHIMGWDIKEDGFGVILSTELPDLLSGQLKPALEAFLEANGVSLGELNGFILHPGGARVLSTIGEVLGLSQDELAHSWAVLREYGNMSSPTVLFVLDQAILAGARGPHLLMAFGPGFSAYFLLADL